jgi:hypothetical protein
MEPPGIRGSAYAPGGTENRINVTNPLRSSSTLWKIARGVEARKKATDSAPKPHAGTSEPRNEVVMASTL